MADMTSYAEAVREVSAARREIPARRGYPGYLYSDLASLYERCGRIQGRPGSVTVLPVLTMPAGDITHPVPDLTGLHHRGPDRARSRGRGPRGLPAGGRAVLAVPADAQAARGPGAPATTTCDVAAQVLAALARARQVRELAELVGASALSETDRAYLAFRETVERDLFAQGTDEGRELADTLDRAWEALDVLPRRELTMLPAAMVAEHLGSSR